MPRPWLHSGEINAFPCSKKVNPYLTLNLTLATGQTVLTINGVRNEPESCTAKCSTRRPELRMLEKVKDSVRNSPESKPPQSADTVHAQKLSFNPNWIN